jgi:hypothetical protein
MAHRAAQGGTRNATGGQHWRPITLRDVSASQKRSKQQTANAKKIADATQEHHKECNSIRAEN